MNLGDIKARTMRNINFVYNDGDHIKNLINEALVMIAADARIQASVAVTLIPGQKNYDLPTNYKEPISLVAPDNCNYTLTDIDSYETGFYIYGSELFLRPEPQESKVVTLNYYQYPDELFNEDDVPDIDPRYHDVLATYAAAMVLSLPNIENVNTSLIERYFAVWEQRRAQFKVEMQRKHKQTSVRRVTNYQ
jgi:hypothetical protein